MGNIEVVSGGQFGSEGKGAITAWRARAARANSQATLAMRVAGPNAGHTVIGDRGTDTTDSVAPNLCERTDGFGWDASSPNDRFAWRLRSVPVAAVINPAATLALGPGSEIDLEVLINEIQALDAAGYNVSDRMVVDPEATLISLKHKYEEKYGLGSYTQQDPLVDDANGIATVIGSTGKGIGAARADRLWRVPEVSLAENKDAQAALFEAGVSITSVPGLARDYLDHSNTVVQIEGTQGYGLGLRAGFYPFCTASDCRAIDFLAMAGLSPWEANVDDFTVWVCFRPYPIRVGGNSGPLKAETTWEELGLPTEHTTVTGKVRRVGAWDGTLAREALRANGGPDGAVKVALTMFDTVFPLVQGWDTLTDPGAGAMVERSAALGALSFYENELETSIAAVGTGPDSVWIP